jgi:hypothetical protein
MTANIQKQLNLFIFRNTILKLRNQYYLINYGHFVSFMRLQ